MGDGWHIGCQPQAHYPAMRSILIFFLITLPWLNPFAPGPSASVAPLMASAACGAALLALGAIAPPRGLSADAAPAAAQAWLVAAALSSAIGLGQYFGTGAHLLPLVSHAEPGEAFANLRQRNQFASLTVIGMASLLWSTSRGLKGSGAVAAMVLLAVGNAASASRTGLLQMLMLTVFTAVWPEPNRQKRLRLCLVGGLAYLAAALLLPAMLELVTGAMAANVLGRIASGPSCGSRSVLWSNVLHLIAQKPWLGWGWGELDYAHYITQYPGARFCDILDHAHNLPLHLAVELGVPAAVLICGGFGWWGLRQKPWRESDPTRQLAWSVLAVILLHSMLEYPLWYGPFQIAFLLCLGLLRRSSAPLMGDASASPGQRGTRAALALAMLAVIAFAAWDYRRVSQIYLQPEARAVGYRDNTLEQVRKTRLFQDQALFAELTITSLSRANAAWIFETASRLLHFSPEPRVIEKLIESAVMLGRDGEARVHLDRFRVAFPEEYARWRASQTASPLKPFRPDA